jgi:hypothetical protein
LADLGLRIHVFVSVASSESVGRAQDVHPQSPAAAPAIGVPAIPFNLTMLDGKLATVESFCGKPLEELV